MTDTTTKTTETTADATQKRFERLVDMIEYDVRSAEQTIAEFAEKVGDDPAYAFEWSRNAFDAAGEIKAFRPLLDLLRDVNAESGPAAALSAARAFAMDRVIRGATSPPSSTSAQSNLVEQSVLKAYGRALDPFVGFGLSKDNEEVAS